ncbi:hypothetical protein H0G86_008179 [Trichoderma simmonsii]|uniref:Uncharacterized protein n=1 Tax=Trichoderma simmonsii TaxID=1491479 RepID=A0A8G0LFI5_9HYPO|nr:hypothetical protein H0G86_008179 [Trichoderma simmonsii]
MPDSIPYDPSLVMGLHAVVPKTAEEADKDAVQQTENEEHDDKPTSSDSGSSLIPRCDILRDIYMELCLI